MICAQNALDHDERKNCLKDEKICSCVDELRVAMLEQSERCGRESCGNSLPLQEDVKTKSLVDVLICNHTNWHVRSHKSFSKIA